MLPAVNTLWPLIVFIGWGSAVEKEFGEVMWTVFGSIFDWRTSYPSLFVLVLIHFNQMPGHFVYLATATTYISVI